MAMLGSPPGQPFQEHIVRFAVRAAPEFARAFVDRDDLALRRPAVVRPLLCSMFGAPPRFETRFAGARRH
eukprot:10710653-Lingulodinium_polyedra.AAC.1